MSEPSSDKPTLQTWVEASIVAIESVDISVSEMARNDIDGENGTITYWELRLLLKSAAEALRALGGLHSVKA